MRRARALPSGLPDGVRVDARTDAVMVDDGPWDAWTAWALTQASEGRAIPQRAADAIRASASERGGDGAGDGDGPAPGRSGAADG